MLEGNPDRARVLAAQRPILLVGVPRCEAASCLLVERLVMVNADTLDAHQFRGNPPKPLAKGKLAADLVLCPEIHDLQERTLIRAALGHWPGLRIQTDDLLRDRVAVILEHVWRQDVLEFHVAFDTEMRDGASWQREGDSQLLAQPGAIEGSGAHDATESSAMSAVATNRVIGKLEQWSDFAVFKRKDVDKELEIGTAPSRIVLILHETYLGKHPRPAGSDGDTVRLLHLCRRG